jgi:ankyrin repeat protein
VGSAGAQQDAERFRRLDSAFRAGDLDVLRDELGALPDFPNVVAHPAIGACLTYAIYHGPIELVRSLLDAGADPDWPSDDGFPPLIAALSCADTAPGIVTRTDVRELVKILLEHGADVGQRGLNDYTPLHWTASQGDIASVELLLGHGANPNEITRIDDLETAYEVAAVAGHSEVMDRLEPLTTRLHWEQASQAADIDAFRRMLRQGHDIDATDGYGQTALMRAAHRGQLDVVKWLIGHGADLDHTSKFHLSALMLSVIAGHPRIARALVAAGADATITCNGAPGFHGKNVADLALDRGDKRLAAFINSQLNRAGG